MCTINICCDSSSCWFPVNSCVLHVHKVASVCDLVKSGKYNQGYENIIFQKPCLQAMYYCSLLLCVYCMFEPFANILISLNQESVIKEYENIKFQKPFQQAMYYCSLLLEDHSWPWSEELEAVTHLEANDLATFVPHLLSKAFIECYIAGSNCVCSYFSIF